MLCSTLGLNGYKWCLGDKDASAEVEGWCCLSEVLVVAGQINVMCGKGLVKRPVRFYVIQCKAP